MKFASKIQIQTENPEELFKLLKNEEKKNIRSTVSVVKENNKIIVNVDACDTPSFRSNINALGQLFSIYEKAKTLI